MSVILEYCKSTIFSGETLMFVKKSKRPNGKICISIVQ